VQAKKVNKVTKKAEDEHFKQLAAAVRQASDTFEKKCLSPDGVAEMLQSTVPFLPWDGDAG